MNSGNGEFKSAKKTLLGAIENMHMEEVDVFMNEFIPSYGKTLDELQNM